MKRLAVLALALTMTAAFVGSAQVQAASFGGLGMLPGPSAASLANDVSDDGSTVVGVSYRLGAFPRFEAFRWRAETGMVGLGMLNPALRVPYSEAIAVSADGSVVVGQSTVEAGLLADQAFRWDATSGLAGLPEAGTSYAATQAYDVSGDGSVIVGRGLVDLLHSGGFRWEASMGMIDMADLPGGAATVSAEAVSSDGHVIVGARPTASRKEAFRWDAANGLIGLNQPGDTISSHALATSVDGSVIVGFTGDTVTTAFRWDATSGMVSLDAQALGFVSTRPHAVSADGSVIVGVGRNAVSEAAAFVWDPTNGVRRLDAVLADLGVDLGGWTLLAATGVSADGRTLVGNGINADGSEEGWIAVIPEPGIALLLGLGLAGLAMGRSR